MASSSSVQQKHKVFLSFKGKDTRNNFISHLHSALKQKGINTFIDDKLIRGKEISQALLTAIQDSKISVIVFSQNYASSSRCLDELSKILECKQRNGQQVIPIFYHVDPSDVRNQTGSFGKEFAKSVKKRTNKVERWSAALDEVAGLAGHHIEQDRSEATYVEKIVNDISNRLKYRVFYRFLYRFFYNTKYRNVPVQIEYPMKKYTVISNGVVINKFY